MTTPLQALRALVRSEEAAEQHTTSCPTCSSGSLCSTGQRLVMANLSATLEARVMVDRADGVEVAFPRTASA